MDGKMTHYTDEERAAALKAARVWVGDSQPGSDEYLQRAVNGALNGLRFHREDRLSGRQSFLVTVPKEP
jgi:hypothetical protein